MISIYYFSEDMDAWEKHRESWREKGGAGAAFDSPLLDMAEEDLPLIAQALTAETDYPEKSMNFSTYIDIGELEQGEEGLMWLWVDGHPTAVVVVIEWRTRGMDTIHLMWPREYLPHTIKGSSKLDLLRILNPGPTAAPPQPQEPTSTPAEPEAETLPTAAPDEQTNEQPAETSAEELTPPSRFVLSAEPRDGELQPGETGTVVLTAINPVSNSTDMELVLTLAAADGLEITDPSGQFDPRTGTGVYTAAPGAEAAVRLDVSAPSPGRYTIAGRAEYRPRGGETAGFVELNHTFVVAASPEAEAGADEPEAPADTDPQTGTGTGEQPAPSGSGNGGGCAIGSPQSGTDLSTAMLGGAMLTGLGMMLVRRRRDQS